jgi:hypothetical protein
VCSSIERTPRTFATPTTFIQEIAMMTLAAVTGVKRLVGAGVFAAALMAMVGVQSAGLAADAPRLFSVAVRITYPNGFVYDHAFATGVPTSDLFAILQACGQGHAYGPGVRFHCYAIPE